jgi:chromosome segregation protein
VEIRAQPPGKRLGNLALLSGGERALTSCALLFALIGAGGAPFCVLDEVDAALDESNVGRFCDLLEELAQDTQFIIVTHNRGTIERASTLYGVSMEASGVSSLLGLRLADARQEDARESA